MGNRGFRPYEDSRPLVSIAHPLGIYEHYSYELLPDVMGLFTISLEVSSDIHGTTFVHPKPANADAEAAGVTLKRVTVTRQTIQNASALRASDSENAR